MKVQKMHLNSVCRWQDQSLKFKKTCIGLLFDFITPVRNVELIEFNNNFRAVIFRKIIKIELKQVRG